MTPEEFYAACNLKGNPFRTNAVDEEDPRVKIWVGYDRQRDQLEKMLDRVRADRVGLTNFILLYGQYGTGKSHALLWAKHWVKTNRAGLAYFIPTLKKDKGKMSFSAAFLTDIVERGSLVSDLRSFKHFVEARVYAVKTDTESTEVGIDRLIKSRELAEFVKRLVRCETDANFKELAGDSKMTDYQAVNTFAKMVNLFTHGFDTPNGKVRFKPAVYLLIDELDDLGRQPAKEVIETNDTLRHLFDSCPNAFGLICALSAEVTTLTNMFTDYVLSRVSRQLHFDMLDREAAVGFIREVMDCSRQEDSPQKKGPYPFNDEALISVMSQLREITPRKVVNNMQQVIEELRLQDYNPATRGVVSNDVLDELKILDAVFGDGASA
jgi:hypothetical protein